jgi:hypothetical protein
MHIRTTIDPITLNEVPDPDDHPCLYEGDGVNGLEIYFESEQTRDAYMALRTEDHTVLASDDSEDYVAEG